MAQQITSTNSSSILDPAIVVQSSESTKTSSDLTSILPIQPKNLFHSCITREATTPSNGQPHVRVGAVLPKWWTLIAFEPTPSMMLTEFQANVAAYIFSDMLDPHVCLVPEKCVESRVINLAALMITRRYALSDKYKPADVIFYFFGAYMSLKVSHVIRIFIPIYEESHWYLVIVDFTSRRLILLDSLPCVGKHQQRKRNVIKVIAPLFGLSTQKIRSNDSRFWINDSTRMRLAVDMVLEEYNDLCLVIQENAWKYRSTVEAEHKEMYF
ncbi:hypothetical protein Ahy_A03g010491 [Arachis hypogaea]|uniref:Ubiquitin-like protease family profile domain-containing protein n=1 Tax=Arachis hypogaea TaxID=3818 RepID=A0A445DMQ9_ARAHY|nr:hypothetical protein Ahy_A03g010491 [Arachis hypogaea]